MQSSSSLSSGEEAQLKLEEESFRAGITAYRERTNKHASKHTESHTDYGKRLIACVVEPLERAIKQFVEDAQHKPGRLHSAVVHLEQVDADVAAFVAARCIMDGLSAYKRKVQAVAIRIGGQVEDELRFRRFEENKGGLFRKVNERFDETPWNYNRRRRRATLTHAATKFQVPHERWSTREKLRVGMKLVELFITSTRWMRLGLDTKARNTPRYLEPTEQLLEWIKGFKDRSEILRPFRLPMVCPPKPWSTLEEGGYYSERCRRPLIKDRMSRASEPRPMPAVYEAVNALQGTPWCVNRTMLAHVNEIWTAGMQVKGLPSQHDLPLPAKPANFDADKEAMTAWKREAADIYRTNRKTVSNRVRAARIMYLAKEFRDLPAIWFPTELDFRGRVYLMPQHLNPQGCDLSKGLLTFAEGKPLGERGVFWLAVHLANSFGHDKCSLQERHAWAVANSARICRAANEPLADRWWTEADKPFQFLAAAIEWLGYQTDGEGYVCHLPIMVDGSCNGLQHLSAMLRDETCGGQVNLVPQETPADIYAAVASALTLRLKEEAGVGGERADLASLWLRYGVDRKLCKGPVMVLPYGGTGTTFQRLLLDAVLERQTETSNRHPFGSELHMACTRLAALLVDVMHEVIVGPCVTMKWLKSVARRANKSGGPIGWTAPSGFYVHQEYLEMESRRVKLLADGKTLTLSVAQETTKLDKRKQARSIAPNFVHSMDAAALTLTLCAASAAGLRHLAAVHDSYGTLPADMDTLMDCTRESFVRMYEENDVLEQFRVEVGSVGEELALPPVPTKGTLDLRGVLRSNYFFA